MSMAWASPDIIWLAAVLAGLVFELMVIASLNIALAVGALASRGQHPLRGAVCGSVALAALVAFLVAWAPLAHLRGYARCVAPQSDQCGLMANGG